MKKYQKLKATRNALEKLHWKFYRKQGLNCEIWKKGKMFILWNRITKTVYVLTP